MTSYMTIDYIYNMNLTNIAHFPTSPQVHVLGLKDLPTASGAMTVSLLPGLLWSLRRSKAAGTLGAVAASCGATGGASSGASGVATGGASSGVSGVATGGASGLQGAGLHGGGVFMGIIGFITGGAGSMHDKAGSKVLR